MVGDLVSLRMLVVAAARPEQELWRQGAAKASLPVDFYAQDAASAAGTLAGGEIDICVLDAALPDSHMAA
jgi:hypothetical protein